MSDDPRDQGLGLTHKRDWYDRLLRVQRPTTLEEVLEKCHANQYVALTHKTMASTVFSFGRDHGYFGRLLNQTVIAQPTLAVRGGAGNHWLLLHAARWQFVIEQPGGDGLAARAADIRGPHAVRRRIPV